MIWEFKSQAILVGPFMVDNKGMPLAGTTGNEDGSLLFTRGGAVELHIKNRPIALSNCLLFFRWEPCPYCCRSDEYAGYISAECQTAVGGGCGLGVWLAVTILHTRFS